jgi:micrococcal nuclease
LEVERPQSLECLSSTVGEEAGEVVEVLDGDTILVSLDGIVKSVRYIGIDSPERGDAASTAATLGNIELVFGEEVTLIRDVSDLDRYDRLLRYVLVDGVFVNLELVSRGLAVAKDYPPDSSCARVFAEAEFQARSLEAGIWAFALPVEAITLSPSVPTLGQGCDPSYPTVCIPSPPPDLDCGDVSFRRFQVKPPDPHRFDGDGDGIGCES